MLHDQDQSLQSSPQRFIESLDFKSSIEPNLLIDEVDEADEEYYKKKQQSHLDIQVNSGKHLVPRFPSSQIISKSSSQITQFSVDLKRQAQTYINNNNQNTQNVGYMGYSMQSSINSDAMKNLIKDANNQQQRPSGSFVKQQSKHNDFQVLQGQANHDNNQRVAKHARQYSHQIDNSSVLIASISLEDDDLSQHLQQNHNLLQEIHQNNNQRVDQQKSNNKNDLTKHLQQENNGLSNTTSVNNLNNLLLYQNTSNVHLDMNTSQSMANTQIYNNVQQPTTNYGQTITISGQQSKKHNKSQQRHKKTFSMSSGQKSMQFLPRTSQQDFESIFQYVNKQKNTNNAQNNSNNNSIIKSSTQTGLNNNNLKSRQTNQYIAQNVDHNGQLTTTTVSFGLNKSIITNSQRSPIQNKSNSSNKNKQNSNSKSFVGKSQLSLRDTNVNSTQVTSVNVSSFIKPSTAISNGMNSIIIKQNTTADKPQQNEAGNETTKNNQMYFQNLNDLLSNKINEQMQALISIKKELQSKVKEQQMIRTKEQQYLQSQQMTEQMLNTELKHVLQKQQQSHSLNQELEDNIQQIMQKQQDKAIDYENEHEQLQNMLNQQQNHFNNVQMQHQQIKEDEQTTIQRQQEQIYQKEMSIIDCEEQILDMTMQYKQINQHEQNLTQLVKENNNQMSRIITIDHVNNVMQQSTKNSNNNNSSIYKGKQLLTSTLNISNILNTGGNTTTKSSSVRSSFAHSRSLSKTSKIMQQQSNTSIHKK